MVDSSSPLHHPASTMKRNEKLLVKKYKTWLHPHMTWKDLFLNFLGAFLFPFHKLARYKLNDTSTTTASAAASNDLDEETKHFVASLRVKSSKLNMYGLIGPIRTWSRHTSSGEIVECMYKIQRPQRRNDQDDRMEDKSDSHFPSSSTSGTGTSIAGGSRASTNGGYGDPPSDLLLSLLDAAAPHLDTNHGDDPLMVRLFLPRDIVLPAGDDDCAALQLSQEKTPYGCLQLNGQLDLSTIPEHVPLVLYFHGGGFTVGDSTEIAGVELLAHAIEKRCSSSGGQNNYDHHAGCSHVIFASVEYRLAPEWTFPAAPVDALIALDHFLRLGKKRPIHIVGVSAGGNLAAVTALEYVRHMNKIVASGDTELGLTTTAGEGNHLKSCMVLCPMLDPAADSMSHYQHSQLFLLVPVSSLRWCWRAVLKLPEALPDIKATKGDSSSALDDLLAKGSNRNTWAEWREKQKEPSLERLANPILGISQLTFTEDAVLTYPTFTVMTSRADALQDEGNQFANLLKEAGAAVHLINGPGSHWAGACGDKETYQAMVSDLVSYLEDSCVNRV